MFRDFLCGRSTRNIFFVISLFFFGCPSHAPAGDIFWQLSPPATGDWIDLNNWLTLTLPTSVDTARIINGGTTTIGSGLIDVMGVELGDTLTGTLMQSGGSLAVDLFNINSLGEFDFAGGTLTIESQLNLLGAFDATGGNGAIVALDNSFVDLSDGTLSGLGGTSFTGGVGSTLLLPQGVDPNTLFSSFTTQGDFFNVSGTKLIVPFGFTLDITGDRPDLTRVEGILRPEGSPVSPQSLTFDQGGVEVAPGGLFNMHGASLTLRTNSSVIGGELRDVGSLVIADQTDDNVTFTQSSGITDINSNLFVGLAPSGSSNPRGTFNMNGGSLSIGGGMWLGASGANPNFSEGTFRQTAGTTTVGSSIVVADRTFSTGTVELTAGTLNVGNGITVGTGTTSMGSLVISGGALDVTGNVTVGRSDGQSIAQLTQSSGNFSVDAITVHTASRYDLTGGTLAIADRFDLTGILDFGGGNANITLADNGVVEWSAGTLSGIVSSTHYSAGIDSLSFFPAGFDPNIEFASFSSQGLVHTQGTTLVVPVGFTLNITGGRPDPIRVEGILRPEGSPASPQSLTFNQGGVEVPAGGLFNLFGASLTLRADSSVTGGEIRNAGTFVLGDVNNEHHTFTQSSGITDINGNAFIGLGTSGSSTARGTFNMNGGSLSIGGGMWLGASGANPNFSEGTFRQTAGTTTVGSSIVVSDRAFSTGGVELLGGTVSVGGNVTLASATNANGTMVLGGGMLDVTGDVTVGRSAGDSIGQLTQNSGDFSLNSITIHPGGRYDLTGGTLAIADRFDLTGILDFGGGNASITLADNGVVEWSTGTLSGIVSSTNYSAGLNSQSFFPVGFNPFTEFASFSSQGLVHSTATGIQIPTSFDDRIFQLTASDLFVSGKVTLNPGGTINSNNFSLTGGILQGDGLVNSNSFINGGTISPGESIGGFTIDSPYQQTASGSLVIEIGGFLPGTSLDEIEIIGSAMLDGELHVSLFDDGNGLFLPGTGDSFTFLTATGGVQNQFSSVHLPEFAEGLFFDWDVQYNATDVRLKVLDVFLAADFNLDGFVNNGDLSSWNANYGLSGGALHSNGDANGDGTVDGEDFLIWQRQLDGFLAADFNRDGLVNNGDLSIWKAQYGLAGGASQSTGDANGDGVVDGRDFLVWQALVSGSSPLASEASQVPEPTAIAMVFVGLLAAIRYGRRYR